MARRRLTATLLIALLATPLLSGPASGADTAKKKVKTLRILVTNDDGVEGEGMHLLIDALLEEPKVQVTVVAPLENQSGTGDQTSATPPTATAVSLPNGYEATAVAGFPADSVVHALDVLELKPHVVLSGINEGQNLGPISDVSGTVGAAKTAVRQGIPALAVSQGISDAPDFAAGVEFAIEWLREHRKALTKAKGTGATDVESLNVPTCLVGEVRGLVEVPLATEGEGAIVQPDQVNCESTLTDPADDITAFNNGYAVLSVVDPA